MKSITLNKTKFISTLLYSLLIVIACNSHSIKSQNDKSLDTTFNSKIWLSGNTYLRGRMVNDLIKSNVLKSISVDSLKNLLGHPSEIDSSFYTYMVSAMDTSITNNYMLLHIEIDTASSIVNDYWLTD